MDFVGERYYKLNRILLTALGLWPYNNPVFKPIQRIFFALLLSLSICLQIRKLVTVISNLELLLQTLSFAVPCLVFSLKYTTFCIQSENMKKLMDHIKYNWSMTKYKEEINILQQYSNLGNMFAIFLSILFYSFVLMFLTMQMLPKILDVVMPLNESRPNELMGLATIILDQEKYFFLIFIHMTVALLVETTTIVATESLSFAYLQHNCALFKIVRSNIFLRVYFSLQLFLSTRILYLRSFRIEHIFDCELHIPISKKNMIYYTNIIDAIFIHNRAIEYFGFLNSNFELSYFILLILGVSSLSINMFRVVQAGLMEKMEEVFAIGLLLIAHFVYMFIISFMAQRIIDHSTDVYYKTCDLPWYSIPVQLQKLLQFIMQRSMAGCKFTAYGIFTESLELFVTLMSVSFSYFTVFLSLYSLQH